mmetsp:Transcript_111672/g.315842  ORF Transcript_111672/g.315842 Transcript_111672/m.315842 type:complete len:491 (+) Transcript_111672:69-1541(+)|eukprot:CAMPEP_0168408068 /NCGR_PEP_ID=MMETSP0228-20121227/26483_1 /TAXON_ID=133427 /ORGANISM="Protoceratium reticulatum, Strain CCCM 535 (=CCMP 1889)" /LENGTH=490 /DNA_ID=CAMNT_0008421749 /DNA_START=69 /DNA_END=1541 /DNA_ORIENTATION=+
MKCKGNRKSKRTKLSLKYNIQKRVREHRRRVRKEAKKLGVKKKARKDPGIPNSWPFKAEMLQDLELQREKREEEIAARRSEVKKKAEQEKERIASESRQVAREKESERRAHRAQEAQRVQQDALRHTLTKAEVLLQVLDARDPLGCRCSAFEAWAQASGKRVIYVLAKADLIAPQLTAQWLQVLGQSAPAVAVQAEAGREGIPELLALLRCAQVPAGAVPAGAAAPTEAGMPAAVGVVGYPGTGKKALCRAMRREANGRARWLMDTVGRFRPVDGELGIERMLHLAVRGAMPSETPNGSATPIDVVKHMLERSEQPGVMRRFRVATFDSAEALLRAYAKDRNLKTKKGKEQKPEAMARHLLADLSALPGCACVPQPASATPAVALWPPHAAARAGLEAAMLAQATALQGRGAGPTVAALQLAPRGPGPAVDMAAALAEPARAEPEEEEDAEILVEGDDEEGDEEEGAEEGEEEEMEGDESEEDEGDEMED